MTRYRLDNDDDGHWYLIPADKKDEFDEFVYGDENADQPEWARSLGCHPNNVTFTSPEVFSQPID